MSPRFWSVFFQESEETISPPLPQLWPTWKSNRRKWLRCDWRGRSSFLSPEAESVLEWCLGFPQVSQTSPEAPPTNQGGCETTEAMGFRLTWFREFCIDLLCFCIGGMKSLHEARSESSPVWKWRFKNKSRGVERALFYWTLIAYQHLCSVPHTCSLIPHHNPQSIIIFLIPRRLSLTKNHEIQVTEFQPHFIYLHKVCSFPNMNAVVESEASGIWYSLTTLTLSFLTWKLGPVDSPTVNKVFETYWACAWYIKSPQ